MMKTEPVRGLPAHLKLRGGTHAIDTFVFDSATTASAVWLVGEPQTTLTLKPSAPWLLELRAGAPHVELQHLILRAPLKVSGGSLTLRNSVFGSCQAAFGGAISITSGKVRAERTLFTGNMAQFGGAIFASGGLAEFENCAFVQNQANRSGGAITINGTANVTLSNGSLLSSNVALLGVGTAVHRASATAKLAYTLPAPLGRWIEGLGRTTVEPLAIVSQLNADYPNPCAPGIVGSDQSIATQSFSACSGLCPAGSVCAGGTAYPASCAIGHFCPAGSAIATACAEGTYSSVPNLTSAAGCVPTGPGFFSPAGSIEPVPCSAGSIAAAGHLGRCTACTPGTYQSNPGATACKLCTLGYYCSAGAASPIGCPPGKFSASARLGTEAGCTACPLGSFCTLGTSTPELCASGRYGGASGQSTVSALAHAIVAISVNRAARATRPKCALAGASTLILEEGTKPLASQVQRAPTYRSRRPKGPRIVLPVITSLLREWLNASRVPAVSTNRGLAKLHAGGVMLGGVLTVDRCSVRTVQRTSLSDGQLFQVHAVQYDPGDHVRCEFHV